MSLERIRRDFAEDLRGPVDRHLFYYSKALLTIDLFKHSFPVTFAADELTWQEVFAVLEQLEKLPLDLHRTVETAIYEAYKDVVDLLVEEFNDYPNAEALLSENGEGRGFSDLSLPQAPNDVWRLVKWQDIALSRSFDEDAINAVIRCKTAWDVEHDLGVFFRNGTEFLAASEPSFVI